MRLYSVAFKENGKGYYFNGESEIQENDYVIVETDKGEQFGKVTKVLKLESDSEKYKNIIRIASGEDIQEYHKLLKEAAKALTKCRELVKKFELNMNVISAEFNFDKSQLIFNFVSDERVDFRELARSLAGIYHTRIELRQIGARDKAKEVGGVGVCGQKICCGRFLNHIDAISMNMAKNQNLALNPTKINGLCGRLLCCLQYEDDNYLECSKGLPTIGTEIKTNGGLGKVVSVDILNRKVKVLVNGTKEEIVYPINEK